MNVIESVLIMILILAACFGFLVVVGVIKSKQTPDGIIAISEVDGKLKANFILCMPIEEFLNQERVTFEVQHISDEELSQEIQDT